MPLLNYTTSIEAAKTVSEIQRTLVAHGGRQMLVDYGDDGNEKGLAFKVPTEHGDLAFRLPVDPEAVLKVLTRQYQLRKVPYRYANRPQAVRVAWRIIKDWVEAQMAILETEMVTMEQIFLPYLMTPGGKTLYEGMVSAKFQLGSGSDRPDQNAKG